MRRVALLHLTFLAVWTASLLTPVAAQAGSRPDKEWKDWFGHFSGGYTFAQGDFGDIVDDDWTISGGALYWPQEWPVGIDIELAYNDMDLSRKAINFLNDQVFDDPNNSGSIDGGDVQIWSLTVSALWGPGKKASGIYLAAGLGGYYLKGRVTSTGLVYYPPVCDPWYWWCYPGGVGPGTYIVGSDSTTEFGANAGLGYTFEVGSSGSQIYVEARYHWVDTDRKTTQYIPVTVGFRW